MRIDAGGRADVFEAIRDVSAFDVEDIIKRGQAVEDFLQSPAAASLAEANKRINNILKKNRLDANLKVNAETLVETAEKNLYAEHASAAKAVTIELSQANYPKALEVLAGLHKVIDEFFENVMVMSEDEKLRNNRLAMLSELRATFLQIADISKLAI